MTNNFIMEKRNYSLDDNDDDDDDDEILIHHHTITYNGY